MAAILGLCYALSTNRKAIRLKTVLWGLGLQIAVAIVVLKGELISSSLSFLDLPSAPIAAIVVGAAILIAALDRTGKLPSGFGPGKAWLVWGVPTALFALRFNWVARVFEGMRGVATRLMSHAGEGAAFVFGALGSADDPKGLGFVFAFQVLPTIIFIASIFAILYYLGIMQVVVRIFARIMTRFLAASGAESLCVAASIFMGQTEAPLTIRPFLDDLTESELMTIMTAGMAHVSGAIMVAYVMVAKVDIVHLLTAVMMTAPGAIVMAKILVPETGKPKTGADVQVEIPKSDVNVIDAAARGAGEGLHLAINVGGMLVAFIALVALVNSGFAAVQGWLAGGGATTLAEVFPKSLETVFGWVFRPVAFLLGVPWKDAGVIGNLLGTRLVLNEFVAFLQLGKLPAGTLDPKSLTIATFALCGFANFSSIAIQVGGIGALAPSRRHDLARLGLRAVLAGTLANFLSAAIAGMLL
jgi:CNT family concentrative nucleoside transporter